MVCKQPYLKSLYEGRCVLGIQTVSTISPVHLTQNRMSCAPYRMLDTPPESTFSHSSSLIISDIPTWPLSMFCCVSAIILVIICLAKLVFLHVRYSHFNKRPTVFYLLVIQTYEGKHSFDAKLYKASFISLSAVWQSCLFK